MQRLSTESLPRAPIGRTFFLFAFLLATTLQSHAWAQASAPSADPLIERREVGAWLNKIHRAAQTQNYIGTFVYQRGSTMRSSKISHFAEKGNEYEELETLDGRQRRILRKNDDVYTLIPERLLAEGTIGSDNLFAPEKLTENEILTTHTAEYWHKLKTQTLSAREARAAAKAATAAPAPAQAN